MMCVDYIEFEGNVYPIVTVTLFDGTEDEFPESVSTETLSKIIVEAEEAGDYGRVRCVDEMIGFFAPDDIVLSFDEKAIVEYVEKHECM